MFPETVFPVLSFLLGGKEKRCNVKRQKRKVICGLLLLLALLLVAGCQQQPEELEPGQARTPLLENQDTTTAVVYYATTDQQWLLPLTVPIKATREVGKVAMERLLAGPADDFAAAVIPADTKLRDLYSAGSVVYVDLTQEITTIDPQLAPLAVDSIVATVLPLAEENQKLQILVEGEVYPALGEVDISQPLGPVRVNCVNCDELAADQDSRELIYYFSDVNAMYLVPQTYVVPAEKWEDQEDIPSYLAGQILDKLLQGPTEDSHLLGAIWPETQILSCQVQDGIAQVDFSPEVLGYGGGAAAERIFLDSLIFSLTSLPEVRQVQILIDGEKVEFLPEGSDISQPLAPPPVLNPQNK